MKRAVWSIPSGGLNTAKNDSAMGTVAAYMNGWRRPRRDLVRSDIEPAMGSMKPSRTRLTETARPASRAGRPRT